MRRFTTYIIVLIALLSFFSFSIKLHRFLAKKESKITPSKTRKEAQKPLPQKKIPPPPSPKTEKPKVLKSSIPFLITPNRHVYIVLLKDKKVLAYTDNSTEKLSRRTQRRILYRVKRAGLKNCICHKIKSRRFLCLFKDASYREAYLPLRCELLIVASAPEDTQYPQTLLDFVNRWQVAWMNIKHDFEKYASFYDKNFKNRYGNLRAWLSYRKANLDKIKYIDLIVEDPVIAKMPSTKNLFAAFFWQTYRSNIKRISSLKGLLIKSENGTLRILTETSL